MVSNDTGQDQLEVVGKGLCPGEDANRPRRVMAMLVSIASKKSYFKLSVTACLPRPFFPLHLPIPL